jgi:hypothetical protein
MRGGVLVIPAAGIEVAGHVVVLVRKRDIALTSRRYCGLRENRGATDDDEQRGGEG